MGAGSCMPNPCATPPGSEQIQCCQADHDEDGPECELSSAAECAADGGVSLGAGTCEPNPCTATPPPGGEVVCCVPDGEPEPEEDGGDGGQGGGMSAECEHTSADACSALGGTNMGPGSCDSDPCQGPSTTTSTTPESTTTTTP